jgi:hypothetical protein
MHPNIVELFLISMGPMVVFGLLLTGPAYSWAPARPAWLQRTFRAYNAWWDTPAGRKAGATLVAGVFAGPIVSMVYAFYTG